MLFGLSLCLGAVQAAGAVDLSVGLPRSGMAADLHFARDEIMLRAREGAGQGGIETRLSRLGIAYAESFGPWLSMGLAGGYLSATQTGQELTGGMRFSGNYAGIDLHTGVPVNERFRLDLGARFTYHWMDDTRDGQKVQLDWAQVDIAATARLALNGWVSLYAGPVHSTIRVDQRARGTTVGTTEFEGRETGGWLGGVLLEVDHGGWVGLELRRGPSDGLALSFQREF